MAILIFFIFLQITDFFFTFHGVNAVGIDRYEANPILVYYMHQFGAAETLFVAKTLSSLLGYLLYKYEISNVLWLLVGFYLYNFFVQIDLFRYNG